MLPQHSDIEIAWYASIQQEPNGWKTVTTQFYIQEFSEYIAPLQDAVYGAIAGCTFFIAREHTQAEYRWIEMFGHGKRINMPWWGGFDPRVWDVASLIDFAVPVVACLLVWLLVNRG